MLKTEVDELLAKLGSAEKAALRLLIDLPDHALNPPDEKRFRSLPWGGVILFEKNIGTREDVVGFVRRLQTIALESCPGYPLLVSVDQEGGSVSPLEKLLTPSPGNMGLSAAGDLDGTYRLMRQMAVEMRSLGINVDFSPVVDVNSNPKNPIIGIRSFGDNPETVSKFADAAIRGLQDEGVMATAKHFPGHGDTTKDSHLDLPTVPRDRKSLEAIDFYPFKKAIESGVWGIMTAHVIYPAIDSKPATLSKIFLTDILRKEMKFEGLIFTDSFEMAAIKKHFDLEEAVIESVRAGADILLALGNWSSQLETFEILKNAIDKKTITDEEIHIPLRRILAYKKKLHDFKPTPISGFSKSENQKLHDKVVTVVSGTERLPLKDDVEILLSPEAETKKSLFQKQFKNATFRSWPWPKASEKRRWLFLAERRLLEYDVGKLLPSLQNEMECVVAFGNPYHLSLLPKVPVRLTTYHLNALLVDAVARTLNGSLKAAGKLPAAL